MNAFKIFGTALLASVFLDTIGVGWLMSSFYQRELASLLRTKEDGSFDPEKFSLIPIYLLIAFGIAFFVVPAVSEKKWVSNSLLKGAAFGLVLYGVYEFTNHSLVKGWPVKIVIADILWGCILCSVTTLVAVWVKRA